MPTLAHDLRYACRLLVRAPGFAAVAATVLALGGEGRHRQSGQGTGRHSGADHGRNRVPVRDPAAIPRPIAGRLRGVGAVALRGARRRRAGLCRRPAQARVRDTTTVRALRSAGPTMSEFPRPPYRIGMSTWSWNALLVRIASGTFPPPGRNEGSVTLIW